MSREAPSLSSLEEGAVSILDAETSRDVTFYLIQVALKTGEAWKIARRYSQFKDLHDRCTYRRFRESGALGMGVSVNCLIGGPNLALCRRLWELGAPCDR